MQDGQRGIGTCPSRGATRIGRRGGSGPADTRIYCSRVRSGAAGVVLIITPPCRPLKQPAPACGCHRPLTTYPLQLLVPGSEAFPLAGDDGEERVHLALGERGAGHRRVTCGQRSASDTTRSPHPPPACRAPVCGCPTGGAVPIAPSLPACLLSSRRPQRALFTAWGGVAAGCLAWWGC